MSEDLIPWLREQILARKAAAEKAPGRRWRVSGDCGCVIGEDGEDRYEIIFEHAGMLYDLKGDCLDDARHAVLNDPRDTIARCEAELAVLGEYEAVRLIADAAREQPGGVSDAVYGVVRGLERVVRLLGTGYQYREGYRAQEWKP